MADPEEAAADAEPHPLHGVLDRLLARERVRRAAPNLEADGPATASRPAAAPANRRMLAVAALGPGDGIEALRSLARWSIRSGIRTVAVDLAGNSREDDAPAAAGGLSIASLPRGLGALRAERPEVVSAVMDRLVRHEASAQLVLVRVPAAEPAVVSRAAFLAGGIAVPVALGDRALRDAILLVRELKEAYPALAVLPVELEQGAGQRFAEMFRSFVGAEMPALDEASEGIEALLEPLRPPPAEGFLAALAAADGAAAPSAGLIEMRSLKL